MADPRMLTTCTDRHEKRDPSDATIGDGLVSLMKSIFISSTNLEELFYRVFGDIEERRSGPQICALGHGGTGVHQEQYDGHGRRGD